MMQVAVCDDEIGTCSDIENMILDYAKSHALQIETEVFYSGEALYRAMQESYQFDLIFLDIQLFQLDGVQVGKQIREQLGNENISIVYISSKETYAMSLFQVRPLDFLIKPVTVEKVNETLEKFIRLNKTMKNTFSLMQANPFTDYIWMRYIILPAMGRKLKYTPIPEKKSSTVL